MGRSLPRPRAPLISVPVDDDVAADAAPELAPDGAAELAVDDEVAGVPVDFSAFFLKAAAVWSPEVAGFTERTMPDLQSEFAEEKNLRARRTVRIVWRKGEVLTRAVGCH